MKILHISAADESTGAGKAALLTHNALLETGHESKILFLKSNLHSIGVFSYEKSGLISRYYRLLITFLDNIPLKFYPRREATIFSPGIFGLKLRNFSLIKWADVIHIHWANHGFVDIKDLKSWNKPVIWTLRDMWAFTGGCHQAFNCRKFHDNCGYCPELHSKKENDLSRYSHNRKMLYMKGFDIRWVAISTWLRKKANESSLLKNSSVEVIHSGVDSTKFRLLDKVEIRKKLRLPHSAKIILLGAANIRSRYKGFEYAVAGLKGINSDYMVMTFGSETFRESEVPQRVIHFGEINDEQLCDLYNTSDVFLGPSIAEAMGKTYIESQFCGLPAICFSETGPEDVIVHKESGYVAEFMNVNDLISGLEFCLNTVFNREEIRAKSIEKFDIRKVAELYMETYNKGK